VNRCINIGTRKTSIACSMHPLSGWSTSGKSPHPALPPCAPHNTTLKSACQALTFWSLTSLKAGGRCRDGVCEPQVWRLVCCTANPSPKEPTGLHTHLAVTRS
jgi:hypothetical protein